MKLKKIVMGIYIFFLLMVPIVTANNLISTSYQTKQMSSIEPLDNYEEIITFIRGSCYSHTINKRGFIRDVEIEAGMGGTLLFVRGWKRNPLGEFGRTTLYIHAFHFIGVFKHDIGPYGRVWGIAFGNVDFR